MNKYLNPNYTRQLIDQKKVIQNYAHTFNAL